jgi:hypothetical protein
MKAKHPLRRLRSSIRDIRDRHLDRHRPSGFGFALADSIDYLEPARWDSVTSDSSFFLKREVLRIIERHGPENIQPRYALIFRGNNPVAVLAAQIVTVRGEHLKPSREFSKSRSPANLLGRVFAPAVKVATSNVRERMIVAGNLLSWGFHGIGFAPGEDPRTLWPGVAEALYRIRRAERLTGQTNFAMVKDLTSSQTGMDVLHRFSYRPMETEPNMVLEIEPAWRNYEDYLSALDARYRRNAKDQMKKLATAGCIVEPLAELEPHAARLHELYLAVHGNASVRLVTLPESYLPELARTAKKDFRCTVIRRDNTLLGFVTSIRDGDTALAYYIGFDRAAAGEGLPIYLRLLHATVADAIDWKCKRLSLGRTALEPKAALGAKPEEMAVWLRHRVPALNWILRGLLGGIPHAEAPERNPFKFKSSSKLADRTSPVQSPPGDRPSVSM